MKIKFLSSLFTKKASNFEHPDGLYKLKFPEGWRMTRINSSEHLFIELRTNQGLIINAYSKTDNSIDYILKLHRDKCLDKEFKPKELKLKEFDLISWMYNFKKDKVLELKRIYHNRNTILDVSFCIKSDLSEGEIESEIDKERLLFHTLELKK
ncbi:hypothetical protein [uncultured Dokdonia sp.]|uniref:hypothetical protein n=1 Tax=uncultured Dokdonia sp. TaxID=575653 RepID=UPI0026212F92|nr:hypothetical protein [uncultured Dokdonia sp.]